MDHVYPDEETHLENKHLAPPGRRVFAIGDIHGRPDLLKILLEKIVDTATSNEGGKNVLVFLGDYVDRGPDSKAVIDMMVSGLPDDFEIVTLIGNHEAMMLTFLNHGEPDSAWLLNGGLATLKSYGCQALETFSKAKLSLFAGNPINALRRCLKKSLPREHLTFLSSLKSYHVEGDYLFVHAGIRPGVSLEEQTESDLMWIRGPFINSQEDFGRLVIHGHTIRDAPEIRNNRIGIDTGAWKSGVLTCLVLDGDEQRFLTT